MTIDSDLCLNKNTERTSVDYRIIRQEENLDAEREICVVGIGANNYYALENALHRAVHIYGCDREAIAQIRALGLCDNDLNIDAEMVRVDFIFRTKD